jgi:succinate-acetate transporter protein
MLFSQLTGFVGQFNNKIMITKAGGGFGVFAAAVAFYIGTAGLLDAGTSFFTLPVGKIKRN